MYMYIYIYTHTDSQFTIWPIYKLPLIEAPIFGVRLEGYQLSLWIDTVCLSPEGNLVWLRRGMPQGNKCLGLPPEKDTLPTAHLLGTPCNSKQNRQPHFSWQEAILTQTSTLPMEWIGPKKEQHLVATQVVFPKRNSKSRNSGSETF